jgi:predicted Fe-Mo cluster-binding NifX family protein
MKTRIAVTVQNKETISAHAGACRNYFIYEIEDDKVTNKYLLELAKNETLKYTFHEDESENPQNKLFDVNIILTGGIGAGANAKLAIRDVKAYVIEEENPDIAIEKIIKGELQAVIPAEHAGGCSCGSH